MSEYNEKGLTMDNWHKCPNILVDKLMGEVLSPDATCVVLTVWRLTEGIRERQQAAIPTETFMRVTRIKRKKTAYQYVTEAVDSGLINVIKERGKVNVYSINKKCPLWYGVEVVAESAPSLEVVAESATGGEKRHTVGSENAPTAPESRGEKRHTYKDNETKDNSKDKKTISESQLAKNNANKSAEALVNFWNENHGKGSSADIKPSVWIDTVKARLKKFTADEIKTAMFSVIQSTWHQQNGQVLIKNAISSDKRCDEAISRYHQAQANKSQGTRYENNQQPSHNCQQPVKQSSADAYEENLARELAERFPDEFPAADHCF